MVIITYNDHTVTVPVIDRGPYVTGRDVDLSAGTAQDPRFHWRAHKRFERSVMANRTNVRTAKRACYR
jgi:rare lipoprotein A (peptidoglycan hydrolase)